MRNSRAVCAPFHGGYPCCAVVGLADDAPCRVVLRFLSPVVATTSTRPACHRITNDPLKTKNNNDGSQTLVFPERCDVLRHPTFTFITSTSSFLC